MENDIRWLLKIGYALDSADASIAEVIAHLAYFMSKGFPSYPPIFGGKEEEVITELLETIKGEKCKKVMEEFIELINEQSN